MFHAYDVGSYQQMTEKDKFQYHAVDD